jgi:hypothetical protein
MKKLLLLLFCTATTTLFAQTKKELIQKQKKEAVANSKFKKQEANKQMLRDSAIKNMAVEDSMRLQVDSVADAQKDSMRLVYMDSGYRVIDSNHKNWHALHYQKTNAWDKNDDFQNKILANAKFLKGNKLRHAKFINNSYCEKAKRITDSESNLTAAYINLNDLRRIELRSLLGKRKERKLEKARKTYIKKHGSIDDAKWMDATDFVAKK